MKSQSSAIVFFLYPAVAMLLGWGLRGTIGGGPVGALIPGAMVALVLCQLLNRGNSVGFIACLGALGIGLGGHQTYGQTIGLSRFEDTYWWGSLGMAVKGAVWGIAGGAVLGLAFIRQRYTHRQILFAMTAMVAATFVGWAYIDAPRLSLFYFSDPAEPRAEIWAGLLLGAVAFLCTLSVTGEDKLPASFAFWGFLFGGLGFGLGGQLIAFGSRLEPPYNSFSWWKGMEFSFGFLLGGGLGIAAYLNRDQLAEPPDDTPELVPKQTPFLPALFLATMLVLTVHRLHFTVPVLFIMVIELAVLTGVVLYSNFFGWHIAVTLTVYAFGLDLIRAIERLLREGKEVYFSANISLWWLLVALLSFATAAAVTANYRAARPSTRTMLLWITWTGTAVGLMKMYQQSQQKYDVNFYFVCGTFLVSAILTTVFALAIPDRPDADIVETT